MSFVHLITLMKGDWWCITFDNLLLYFRNYTIFLYRMFNVKKKVSFEVVIKWIIEKNFFNKVYIKSVGSLMILWHCLCDRNLWYIQISSYKFTLLHPQFQWLVFTFINSRLKKLLSYFGTHLLLFYWTLDIQNINGRNIIDSQFS